MKQTTAEDRQTILDIAISECGSIEAAFDLAMLNSHSVSDDLAVGESLSLPSVVDKAVTDYWALNSISGATAITSDIMSYEDETAADTSPITMEGIGYWTIRGTFIIS